MTFYTFRWYCVRHTPGAFLPLCVLSKKCTRQWRCGLVCLTRTSQHGVIGISRRVYSNSHLPFSKTPNIPVTACSCYLATGRVLWEKRGVIDICVCVCTHGWVRAQTLWAASPSPVSSSLSPQPHCHVMEHSITHSPSWTSPNDTAHTERCL